MKGAGPFQDLHALLVPAGTGEGQAVLEKDPWVFPLQVEGSLQAGNRFLEPVPGGFLEPRGAGGGRAC